MREGTGTQDGTGRLARRTRRRGMRGRSGEDREQTCERVVRAGKRYLG